MQRLAGLLCSILLVFSLTAWTPTDACTLTLNGAAVTPLGPSMSAANCRQLSSAMTLAWKVRGKRITFEVQAATKGWVSVGVNSRSSMRNADVAIGWVDGSRTNHLVDAKTQNFYAVRDVSQDCNLHAMREDDRHTAFVFSRDLDTGDSNGDQAITGGLYLLWAYAATDPRNNQVSDARIHTRRGAIYLNLLSGGSGPAPPGGDQDSSSSRESSESDSSGRLDSPRVEVCLGTLLLSFLASYSSP